MARFLCLFYCCTMLFIAQSALCQDTISFPSGALKLKGLLWVPKGKGPFPAVMYNHGSEKNPEKYVARLQQVFVEHGYAFFALFRRGQGLSIGSGRYIVEQLDSAFKAGGNKGRIKLMIQLHSSSQLQDQLAALSTLETHPLIDKNQIAVVGASFGGIQAMLLAQQSANIKAAVNFAGAAMNWEKSPLVGKWLKKVVADAKVPIFFIQAENDFSTKPSIELAAEMKRHHKSCEVKIYPPHGTTAMDGHTFMMGGIATWSKDVFPWLDKCVVKK